MTPRQHVKCRERRSGSDVLDIHGLLWPTVRVQSEGVVIRTVDVRQHKRLLVFRFRVQRCNVVFVCIVDNLEKETEGHTINAGFTMWYLNALKTSYFIWCDPTWPQNCIFFGHFMWHFWINFYICALPTGWKVSGGPWGNADVHQAEIRKIWTRIWLQSNPIKPLPHTVVLMKVSFYER